MSTVSRPSVSRPIVRPTGVSVNQPDDGSNYSAALYQGPLDDGRISATVGQGTYSGSGCHQHVSATGLRLQTQIREEGFDEPVLSAEASALTAEGGYAYCSSEEASHAGAGVGGSLIQGMLETYFGDERNGLGVSVSGGLGAGGGAYIDRHRNEDGTNTYDFGIGVNILGGIGLRGRLSTESPERIREINQEWEASGLGNPENVGP